MKNLLNVKANKKNGNIKFLKKFVLKDNKYKQLMSFSSEVETLDCKRIILHCGIFSESSDFIRFIFFPPIILVGNNK